MINPGPDTPVPPDVAEARRLCMEHICRKPKSYEITEMEAWLDRKAVLDSQLVKALEAAPAEPEPKEAAMPTARVTPGHLGPQPEEEPMTKHSTPTPAERVNRYVDSFAAATTAKARQNLKYRMKCICEAHGLKMPELPDGRKSESRAAIGPDKDGKPNPKRKAIGMLPAPPPRETSLEPVHQAAIDFGRSIQRHVEKAKPLDDVRAHISGTRAEVWSLLADLERLAPAELAQLAHDLELLDAAAHTALIIEQGRVA